MDFTSQAVLHGAGVLSGPKNSAFNAIQDAMKCDDLTLIFIDADDGSYISGANIRAAARSHAYRADKAVLAVFGQTRD
jgi:hypothetical protein